MTRCIHDFVAAHRANVRFIDEIVLKVENDWKASLTSVCLPCLTTHQPFSPTARQYAHNLFTMYMMLFAVRDTDTFEQFFVPHLPPDFSTFRHQDIIKKSLFPRVYFGDGYITGARAMQVMLRKPFPSKITLPDWVFFHVSRYKWIKPIEWIQANRISMDSIRCILSFASSPSSSIISVASLNETVSEWSIHSDQDVDEDLKLNLDNALNDDPFLELYGNNYPQRTSARCSFRVHNVPDADFDHASEHVRRVFPLFVNQFLTKPDQLFLEMWGSVTRTPIYYTLFQLVFQITFR